MINKLLEFKATIILFFIVSVVFFFGVNRVSAETITVQPIQFFGLGKQETLTSGTFTTNPIPSWYDMVAPQTVASSSASTTPSINSTALGSTWNTSRAGLKFLIPSHSSLPLTSVIFTPKVYLYDNNNTTSTIVFNAWYYDDTKTLNENFGLFGNQEFSPRLSLGIGHYAGYFEEAKTANSLGLNFVKNSISDYSTTTILYLGLRTGYDFDIIDPLDPYSNNFNVSLNDFTLTLNFGTTTPITLTYPSPYQNYNPILINQANQTELIYGTCIGSGTQEVLISTLPYSFIPTNSSFTSPITGTYSVACVNNAWHFLLPIKEGRNSITVWSRDFLNNSRDPIFNEDYIVSSLTGQLIISLAPVTTSSPSISGLWSTSTIDLSNFLASPLSDIPFIGEYLQTIYSSILNKIPLGYFLQVVDIWNKADPNSLNSTFTIDFSFDNKFPELSGLEWEIVDFNDPFKNMSEATETTMNDVITWVNYVVYVLASWWFIDWIIRALKNFINRREQ